MKPLGKKEQLFDWKLYKFFILAPAILTCRVDQGSPSESLKALSG